MINAEKKYRKVNAQVSKGINKRVKPTLKNIGDKIFNKFKSFSTRKKDTAHTVDEANLINNKDRVKNKFFGQE